MTPAATPPTAPSTRPALLFLVADGAGAVLATEEVAAADAVLLATMALTSVGCRVPQVLQAWEPGFALRQSVNCW